MVAVKVIAEDKLPASFDAPKVAGMCLDHNLSGRLMLQAVVRANRTCKEILRIYSGLLWRNAGIHFYQPLHFPFCKIFCNFAYSKNRLYVSRKILSL